MQVVTLKERIWLLVSVIVSVTVRLKQYYITHSDVSSGDLYAPDPVEQLLAPSTSRYQNPCFENRLTLTLCSSLATPLHTLPLAPHLSL